MCRALAAERLAVTGLFVYPVKSCAGVALPEAELGPRGLQHDREYLVVDPDGQFLTQREVPRLALIRPTWTSSGLTLAAPDMPPIRVLAERGGTPREVTVWRDRVAAVDQGSTLAEWLSTYLGVACRLVRQADDAVRLVDPKFARRPTDQVSFVDGYPLLLMSEESLADLNRRLEAALPMNRFRPNVVVAGAIGPYAEDAWREITIGTVQFSVVKACMRCAIPTIDQVTAARGREPLVTLATYRRVAGGVLFGQNLIHHGPGTLRVGDALRIDQAQPESYSLPWIP